MSPEEAKITAKFLATVVEQEYKTTLTVFEAVPDGKLDYRPDPVTRSGLDLVRHIAIEDPWFLSAVIGGEFGPFPEQGDDCGVANGADAAQYYREKMPALIGKIEGLSGEQLTKVLDLLGMIQLPAIVFLSMMIRHSVHHRGQLTSYLRAMGGTMPSIYGPTADTPM